MKCICISCFNHYPTRMKSIIEYFEIMGCETKYLIADYNHFEKRYEEYHNRNWMPIHVSSYERNLSIARMRSHRQFSNRVKKILKQEQPDIIYCMFPPNSLVKEVGLYKQANDACRVVFDCYDMWPESFPVQKYKSFLYVPFSMWRKLRNKYIPLCDKVIAPSFQVKVFLEKLTNRPVEVLYPSMEQTVIPEYSFGVENEIRLCYLGNINFITDVNLCENLITGIAKQKKVIIHHIGEGQYKYEFYKRLESSGADIVSHGTVFDMSQKNKIFSVCHMGLNVPREEIKSSLALKSVEYMRAGLPFINSGKADNASIVEKYGVGINCDRDNIQNTVNTILRLNEKSLVKMHQACKSCYLNLFVNQDLDSLFANVLR